MRWPDVWDFLFEKATFQHLSVDFFLLSAASEMTGTADTLSAQNWPTQSDLRTTIYINSKVHQPNCKGHHEIQADRRNTQQVQVLWISAILCILHLQKKPLYFQKKIYTGVSMDMILRRVSCVKKHELLRLSLIEPERTPNKPARNCQKDTLRWCKHWKVWDQL